MKQILIFGLSLLVLTCGSFIDNRNVTTPDDTTFLLYTQAQKYLVAASSKQVFILSGVNGTKLTTVPLGGKQGISAIATSSDQPIKIAIGFTDGQVLIKEIFGTSEGVKGKAESQITSLCFNSNNQYLISGEENDKFYIMNVNTGSTQDTQTFQNQRVFTVSCSPTDPKLFAVGGGETTLAKFALYTYDSDAKTQLAHDFVGPDQTARGSTFSSDGTKVYRSGKDGIVYVYSTVSPYDQIEQYDTTSSTETLFGVVVSTDGNFVATVNTQKAFIIDVKANIVGYTVETKDTTAQTVALGAKGGNLVIVNSANTAQIYGQCPQGQFYDQTNGCQGCDASCTLCLDSANQCFECKPAHFLDSTVCTACAKGCLDCPSSSQCTTCDTAGHFIPDTVNCQCNRTYFETPQQTCQACSDGCERCNVADVCDDCRTDDGFEKNGNGCKCKVATYEKDQFCQNCVLGCLQCSDGTTCTTCNGAAHFIPSADNTCQCNANQKFIINPTNDACICQSGFYEDQSVCQQCRVGCQTCTEAMKCDTCTTGDLQVRDDICKCVDTSKYVSESGVCQDCSAALIGCTTCDFADVCIACDASLFRREVGGKCQCFSGYYEDEQKLCQACTLPHCTQCSSSEVCTKCDLDNKWIVDTETNKCICQQHFVQVEDQCLSCPAGCLICDQNQICSKCDESENFDPTPTEDGTCTCLARFYFDLASQLCNKCIQGCYACLDATNCITCDTERHFKPATMVKECSCEDTYFYTTDNCELCSSYLQYCQSCRNKDTCDSCSGELKIYDGKCGCPQGQYITSEVGCKECPQGCSACQSQQKCTACKEGYTIDDTACKKDGLDVLIIILIIVGVIAVLGAVFVIIKCIKKKKAPLDYETLDD